VSGRHSFVPAVGLVSYSKQVQKGEEMQWFLRHPWIWEGSRALLDITIGVYRKRIRALRDWGLLDEKLTILDIGCGSGHYARIMPGEYLGVDLHEPYIQRAIRNNAGKRARFECLDVTTHVEDLKGRFDVVLMVDFLHHLPSKECGEILGAAARIARGSIVCFEPVLEQTNPIGRWFIKHDRGEHIRSSQQTLDLMRKAGITVIQQQMLTLGPLNSLAVLASPSR
jgi:SAM-dependent methyltransferase